MLQQIIDQIVYGWLGFSRESQLAAVLHFFIYDSVKILLLLFVMISVVGLLRSYIPHYKIRNWLSGRKATSHFFAAVFGAVTPFCSCSSIPIFLGLVKAGVPLGVTFSFLITSPLINEYLVVLMLGFFGWKITLAYVVSGMLIGGISGFVLGQMKLEQYLERDIVAADSSEIEDERKFENFRARIRFGLREGRGILRDIWLWVLAGVALGAAIHNYVPDEWIQSAIGKAGIFSVPIATLIGVPMYGSCAAIVPVAVVLFQKGIPLGTALAFMMAVAALSLPEAVMLRRAMRFPLIAIFFAITALAIMFTGYLLNAFQPILS